MVVEILVAVVVTLTTRLKVPEEAQTEEVVSQEEARISHTPVTRLPGTRMGPPLRPASSTGHMENPLTGVKNQALVLGESTGYLGQTTNEILTRSTIKMTTTRYIICYTVTVLKTYRK